MLGIIICLLVAGLNAYLGFAGGHWFHWFASGYALGVSFLLLAKFAPKGR